MPKILLLYLLASTIIAGCASSDPNSLRNLAIGATVGAGIGQVAGGDRNATLAGAGIGAAIGSAATKLIDREAKPSVGSISNISGREGKGFEVGQVWVGSYICDNYSHPTRFTAHLYIKSIVANNLEVILSPINTKSSWEASWIMTGPYDPQSTDFVLDPGALLDGRDDWHRSTLVGNVAPSGVKLEAKFKQTSCKDHQFVLGDPSDPEIASLKEESVRVWKRYQMARKK